MMLLVEIIIALFFNGLAMSQHAPGVPAVEEALEALNHQN